MDVVYSFEIESSTVNLKVPSSPAVVFISAKKSICKIPLVIKGTSLLTFPRFRNVPRLVDPSAIVPVVIAFGNGIMATLSKKVVPATSVSVYPPISFILIYLPVAGGIKLLTMNFGEVGLVVDL